MSKKRIDQWPIRIWTGGRAHCKWPICIALTLWHIALLNWMMTLVVRIFYTQHIFFISFLYKIYSKCNEDVRSARKGSSGRKMTVRKHFRLKLAYGRQGLDWIVEPGYSFGVFSTSRFAARALSSVDDPKMLRDQHLAPTDLLWSKNVFWFTGGPNWPFKCWDSRRTSIKKN